MKQRDTRAGRKAIRKKNKNKQHFGRLVMDDDERRHKAAHDAMQADPRLPEEYRNRPFSHELYLQMKLMSH